MPVSARADSVTSATPGTCARLVANRLAQIAQRLLLVLDEVPLVDRDDERTALFGDHVADGQILLLERPFGIDQQHHDFGKADGAHGIAGRKLFRQFADAHLAPQACRIEDADSVTFVDDVARHAVARQSGLGAGDHAVFAQQRIDERRLAGVGTADDGDADRLGRLGCLLGRSLAVVFAFPLGFRQSSDPARRQLR